MKKFRTSQPTILILCAFAIAGVLAGMQCFNLAFARGTVVPHMDINEITKYEDSLSPEDYGSLIERAKQIETMINSSPPKTLDAIEYKQAIETLKSDAKQKVEDRNGDLEQSMRFINDEFNRIGNTYSIYGKDCTDEQKEELDKSIHELKEQWNDPATGRKSINQGLKDCSEFKEKLKQLNDKIIDISMTRKPAASSEMEKDRSPAPGQDDRETEIAVPAPLLGPRMLNPDYRFSPYAKSVVHPESIAIRIDLLQKCLESLKNIKVIGTLEYDALSKEILAVQQLSQRLKQHNGAYYAKDEQILQDKLKSLELSLKTASGN